MLIQEQHIDNRTGQVYFSQIFTVETCKQLSYEDYLRLRTLLEIACESASRGKMVEIKYLLGTDKWMNV
jgi:hypothetical protein